MEPNIFISYSRREVGFVDDLVARLYERKYNNIWLDYRSLVPGQPWEEQIYQGITNSNLVLLVVSKASMASENVEMEWRRVIKEKDRRIILLIFEAVDLPDELMEFEWVDFRGNYEKALDELDRQMRSPEQEEHPAPQTGFKVPPIVWAAFGLSLITGLMSFGALWTLFIPFFLLTLPFRIFKRNFHYMYVEASLIMLPLALYLTSLFTVDDTTWDITGILATVSIPFVIALLFVLRSQGMQRWGKPESIRPTSSHHGNMPGFPEMKSVKFFVEHAPQDAVVAAELTDTLKSHGHSETKDAASANAVFTLISAFKNDSTVDCEKHVVYPVIVQTNKKVSRQISRLQWLDFRLGVKRLDAVAKYLCEPNLLLRALCTRPMGDQLALPSTVLYLAYFITLLAVICIGSWFPYILQYLPDIVDNPDLDAPMLTLVFTLILFGVIAFFMGHHLVNRKGLASSFIGLTVGMLLLGGIIYWQVVIDSTVLTILNLEADVFGYSSYYPTYFYLIGNALMAVYLFFNRADLKRWFPAK